jgi:zinc transport system ATP-binding protein
MPLVVELENVSFGYGHGADVLRDVTLRVAQGEFVALAGPNGGGKTTLVRLVVGLERPRRGRVRLFGEPPDRVARRSRIAYLAQRAQVELDAPISVEELVVAGRTPRRGILGRLDASDRAAVASSIERVGLGEQAGRPLRTLSGGQQQRAFIAKALAAEPELLVLDEPTIGVDVDAQEAIAALLEELRRELRVTVLYVSHEFGAIEPYVERLVLVRGGIVFDGNPAALPDRWHDPSHVHL